jgi:DNA-binding CsgD family transcriptional regulator
MVPAFPIDPIALTFIKRSQTPAPQPPRPIKAKATLPSAKAPAQRSQNDRPTSAPLPLSQREQQVCESLSQGMSFEAIARHLNCSPTAARAYHRRALDKRQRTIALASLEQGDSSAPNDRKAKAQPEPALAEPSQMHCGSCHSGDERSPHQRASSVSDRPACASASICNRSPFHPPAVEASALLERPNPLDLYVPSLFVEGDCVTTRRKLRTKSTHFSQTTITDPPRHPRRRERSSRRSRKATVGFRGAVAS